MDITTHHLVHAEEDGIHIIAFQRNDQGVVNQDFVRQFFSNDLLKATAAMHTLVIDLSGVLSLDSAALGPLVQKLRNVQERRGRMVLAGVQSPALREIFALTRFDKVFTIYPTRADATAALKAPAAGA